jgi:uncharacterized protein (TIGR03067 family)
MRARCLLPLLIGLLLGADAAKDDAKKDQEKMVGTWIIASVQQDGKAVDDAKGLKLEITAAKMTYDGRAYPYKLDASVKPKLLDVTMDKDEVAECIYELDGDTLKLCIHLPSGVKQRPTEFASKQGSQDIFVVLERQKK